VLRVEIEALKWARGGLVSLDDSTSIYFFSTLKQQKTEKITPDQIAFLFLVKTAGLVLTASGYSEPIIS
jgi:hypothetical protein